MSRDDDRLMSLALDQARLAIGRTHPNPAVGAVLVKNGRVIGVGHTQPVGGPHAEVEALRQAGKKASGATLYSTLEPCSHFGRTPPCADAIVKAGVSRVVFSSPDPNPLVNGRGAKRLKAGGVEVLGGVMRAEAEALNRPFFTFMRQARAFVTLKAAITLDGKLATSEGDSKWVSAEASRQRVHRLRDQVDAILVGAGTVAADDPQLTTRLPKGEGKNPVRVVLDQRLTAPTNAAVFRTARQTRTIVATTQSIDSANARALIKRGVEVWRIAGLPDLLKKLGAAGLLHLLVEGGPTVHGSFLKARLFDEVVLFVAPKLVGHRGLTWSGGLHAALMRDALGLQIQSVELLGGDLVLSATPIPAA